MSAKYEELCKKVQVLDETTTGIAQSKQPVKSGSLWALKQT